MYFLVSATILFFWISCKKTILPDHQFLYSQPYLGHIITKELMQSTIEQQYELIWLSKYDKSIWK